jgi:adenylate cyclase
MVRFLGRYLDEMAAAIYAEGGVVYRMLGDGLLVMFGMPVPIENEALSAVRAAVGMAQAARRLQPEWPLGEDQLFCMGIGIHHGQMIDSVIGEGWRVDYAIIGDPANTAARIEAYCKDAAEIPPPPGKEVPENVTILVSEEIYEQVRPHVLADENIPPFAARGKSEPLSVVRILGLKD